MKWVGKEMNDSLRYYLAFNGGLKVLRARNERSEDVGEFFKGKTIEDLAGCCEKPEIVFAAVAFDGGYRTEDGGKTWQKVIDGDVRTFSVDPHDERVVYAGTGPIRLFRSEDRGLNWEPLDGLLQLPDSVRQKWTVPTSVRGRIPPHVRDVFIHPDDPALIYVALEHGGIVRSRDRGKTWEDASAGIDYLDMHQIRSLPGDRERLLVSSARGFYRTENEGREWRRTEQGMPWADTELYSYSHEWLFCPGEPLRIVVGGAKGSPGVWRREQRNPQGHILLSDDLGESWYPASNLPVDLPWAPWVLLHHPTNPDCIFAGMGDGARGFGFDPRKKGEGGLYLSRDRGTSWECIMADQPSILTAWVASD
jgi:hypothetical protein